MWMGWKVRFYYNSLGRIAILKVFVPKSLGKYFCLQYTWFIHQYGTLWRHHLYILFCIKENRGKFACIQKFTAKAGKGEPLIIYVLISRKFKIFVLACMCKCYWGGDKIVHSSKIVSFWTIWWSWRGWKKKKNCCWVCLLRHQISSSVGPWDPLSSWLLSPHIFFVLIAYIWVVLLHLVYVWYRGSYP